MELSNEVKARIFGMYLGCDVYVHYTRLLDMQAPVLLEYMGRGKLLGVLESTIRTQGKWDNVDGKFHDDMPFGLCRLILKPIAEITKEDAEHIAKILCGGNEVLMVQFKDDELAFAVHGFPSVSFKVEEFDIDCIDYLRSKGYALPWQGQSLFELGIAIKI